MDTKKKIVLMASMLLIVFTLAGCKGDTTSVSVEKNDNVTSVEPEKTPEKTPEAESQTDVVENTGNESGMGAEYADYVDSASDYAKVYATYMNRNYYAISNYYYWQFEYEASEYWPYYIPKTEGKMIAFADINKDSVPEMMLVSADEYNSTYAVIRILKPGSDDVTVLYEEYVDIMAEGGSDYVLFQNNVGDIYLYTVDYGVWTAYRYKKLEPGDDGIFRVAEELLYVSKYDYETDSYENEYALDEKNITEEEFSSKIDTITKGTVHAILYDSCIDGNSFEWVKRAQRHSFTFGEAFNLLVVDKDASEGEMPFEGESRWLSFYSGAGAWATDLYLNKDGSFTAEFYDSDMGDSNDDYPNGTLYTANAKGQFTNIQKLDEYTYSMELTEFENSPITEPYVLDETLYVPSETYGISAGKYIMYLPGRHTDDIDEEVLGWGQSHISNIEKYDNLPFFMLFNEETMQAFVD